MKKTKPAPMIEHPKKFRIHERHHDHEHIGSSNAFVLNITVSFKVNYFQVSGRTVGNRPQGRGTNPALRTVYRKRFASAAVSRRRSDRMNRLRCTTRLVENVGFSLRFPASAMPE